MDTTNAASTTAPPATLLTLVRHGQTYLNSRRLLQGSCDSPLTRTGRVGVQVTAQHLSTESFDAAYTSPQGRAVMTAVEIVRRHEGLVLQSRDGLRELSFGTFERRPEHEMETAYPWSRFVPEMLAGTHPGLPGGESGWDYMARVAAVFSQIITENPGRSVLVVGHGLTLGAYLALCGVRGLAGLPNASVSRVLVQGDGEVQVLEVGTDIAGHGQVAARPVLTPQVVDRAAVAEVGGRQPRG